MRVLIADDQKSVGTALADLVLECNHEVVEVVRSGLEAIQAYNRHKPDVVLMDYWMAKLNGGTACRNILAKDPFARVILVSGWSHLNDVDTSGAVALLAKPVDIGQLDYTLNQAFAHNENLRPLPNVEHLGVIGVIEHPDHDERVLLAAAS